MRLLLAALICLLLAAPAIGQKLGKAEQAAIAASPEQVAAVAKVVDDPLDITIRVDTSPFYVVKQGLLKITPGDTYFRAFIDRRTGEALYQKVFWLKHGDDWQMWKRAVAEGPDGPVELQGNSLDSDVSCSRYGCTKLESVAITIPEELLRWVATGARAGTGDLWRMKVYGRFVEGVEAPVLKTEAAGFLIAVDRAKSRLRLSIPVANPPKL